MADSPTRLSKHSVSIAGHRTSITLEAAFWEALTAMAQQRGTTVAGLIAAIDDARAADPATPNLSSAIRVFVLNERNTG
ncbi:ribbon-helix-helix domain-containing protein [Dongia sp.]|uniref:ribbon-helix-helix domain-containing protein n=1 Tax=Dongia sp. TaxID=1977262 RepID=UPI00375305DF